MSITPSAPYQPSDPPPTAYLAWHEWAAVQHKAGYRQTQCHHCCRWLFPQEQAAHECSAERGE